MTGSPVPIARIPAQHNISAAAKDSENEAGGLSSILYLAVGTKIMLRANLWTERGLVNGAIGHVGDILYDKDVNPAEDPPSALACCFLSYNGLYLSEKDRSVIIEPMAKSWRNNKGHQDCTRIQFPVSLCSACSIHKSQGLTLEKAYINIGVLKEMSPGLTYTGLSRVESLSGLLLQPFGFKRLESMNYIKLRQEWLELLSTKEISNLCL